MRNANGTGSITKLSGNRRKPYAVIVTTGFEYDEVKDSYKQKRKYLGYYATQTEARKALADFLDNPYDVNKYDATVESVWNVVKTRLEFIPYRVPFFFYFFFLNPCSMLSERSSISSLTSTVDGNL